MPEKAHKAEAHPKPVAPPEAAPSQPSGFKLPPPDETPPSASPNTAATTTTTTPPPLPPDPAGTGKTDASSRDWAIAGGFLLVLLVASFFVKNAWANHLVSQKIAPLSANLSGWWLFIGLTSVWSAIVLAFVNHDQFLTPIYMVPLGIAALIAFVSAFITSRR